MRKKPPVPFSQKFHDADPLALQLLERLLAFDPKDRPTAEEVIVSNSNISLLQNSNSNCNEILSSWFSNTVLPNITGVYVCRL